MKSANRRIRNHLFSSPIPMPNRDWRHDRGCGMPDQSYVPCPADGVHDYRRSRSLSSEESTSATSPSNAFMRAGHIDGNKSNSTKGKQHRLGGESCRWAGRIGGYRPWYRILVRRERNCMHEKPSIPYHLYEQPNPSCFSSAIDNTTSLCSSLWMKRGGFHFSRDLVRYL